MNFRKVIGQDQGEATRSAPAPSESPKQAPDSSFSSQSAASSAPRGASATRNVLSSDVEIKGSVKFSDDLVIDGKIEGEISSAGNLTIGENARIKAEVKTGCIVVYGKVHGNLTAANSIELKASAEVIGDIKAKTLSIEPGAIFVGKSTVGTPASVPVVNAPAPLTPPNKPNTPASQQATQGTLAVSEPKK